MQDKFSKFLSKLFCCRRHTTIESSIPSPSPSPSPSPRRRRNSPQPRKTQFCKMVANMNTPRLTEYEVDSLEYVVQRAQFECPDGTVKDICWDSERQQVVILNGRDETHYRVDCSNTDILNKDLSLKEVLEVMGYNMRDYKVSGLLCYDANVVLQNALDTPIETLKLMQFNIRARSVQQG